MSRSVTTPSPRCAEQTTSSTRTAPGGGITVFPADREVSKSLATRTVTVSVPYGPNGETLVTFYNRVKLARIKVCKVIPITSQDSLGGKDFTYLIRGLLVGPIKPGECTFYTHDIPILTAPGVPITLTVDEVEAPSALIRRDQHHGHRCPSVHGHEPGQRHRQRSPSVPASTS